MPHVLTAREYKLLLNAGRFRRSSAPERVRQFLQRKIVPLVSAQGSSAVLSSSEFKQPERRSICFRDTKGQLLDSCSYILRERVPDGEPPEVTLKLRVADYFIAAAIAQPGRNRRELPSLEEDIAPLEVPNFRRRRVVVADPPSIRSRFSLSTLQKITANASLETLADAFRLFPTLAKNLAAAGASSVRPVTRLRAGPLIDEHVYKGPKLKFPDGFEGKLSLTLWYFSERASVPRIAEISFKCKMEGAGGTAMRPMTEAAARSALAVFNGLQSGLSEKWLNLEEASKTALALPR